MGKANIKDKADATVKNQNSFLHASGCGMRLRNRL